MDSRQVVEQLLATDVDALDAGGVERTVAMCAQLRGWLDAVQLRLVDRHRALAAADPRLAATEQVMADAGNSSKRQADRVVERTAAATLVPTLIDGMAQGTLTAEHIDALAAAVRGVDDDTRARVAANERTILLMAQGSTPDQFAAAVKRHVKLLSHDDGLSKFERQRRANRFRWWVDRDGMVQTRGQFDPELGLRLTSAIEATVEQLFHGGLPDTCPVDPSERRDHLAALALGAILAGKGAGGDLRLLVAVDLATLQHGLHERSIVDCGGADLPVETIRRMACDAQIIPVVLDGAGVALDVGRARRLATAHQRQALRVMYPTCAFPGCTVTNSHTTAHHIDPWDPVGRTDLGNLLPLCSRHHHAVHEGGWTVELDPQTRMLTVTSPLGVIGRYPPPHAPPAEAA